MRVALVTDAWSPQINGVVTTLQATAAALERRGCETRVISGQSLRSIPCPSYPEIRLALGARVQVAGELARFRPHAIHIATEGPVGLAARRFCIGQRLPFTTSYHTHYPEYLHARWAIPRAMSFAWLRRFHAPAVRTFVSTATLRGQLAARGFRNLHLWRRGVDASRFAAGRGRRPELQVPRPLMAYVGRVAIEKNLPAFLGLDLPGTKLVIGDGPQLPQLRARYPDALFVGFKSGEELVGLLCAADVFVFPSLTDTFGLAMIEAMACGVPVAAFPVPGPRDVIAPGVSGVMHGDLACAIGAALMLDRRRCVEHAMLYTWDAATDEFIAGLARLTVPASQTVVSRSLVRRAETGS